MRVFFFFKRKTAYDMLISDWSSDVCSSDLWFIVATVVLAAAAGYVVSDTEPEYVAQTTIYVGASSIAADPVPGELSNDRLTAIQLMVLNFSKMIDSETIARRAPADLEIGRASCREKVCKYV